MGGKYINKTQAELYMKYRNNKGLPQEVAAAKVDISVRSGRSIEKGLHYTSKPRKSREYKTRKSPIDKVWESTLEPMLLANPDLQAKTLFLFLQRNYTDDAGDPIYTSSIERTLQRRVSKWKALNGSPKNVMFPQNHIPGEQSLSDFTHFDKAEVTIKGVKFDHMFYHFRLVYSKWSYIKVIQSGESMQALSEGLQEALFTLGGAPKEHRTDSLSAAFKNLSKNTKKDLTSSYEDLCSYYNMTPTRNNKGEKHENGSVESAHGHIKNRLAQELILRGSNDFDSISSYEHWVHNVVKLCNKRNSKDFETELMSLQLLPPSKTTDYEVKSVKVSNLSIITVKSITYSVPSTLSGHSITLHIYQSLIKIYLGGTYILDLERKYQKNNVKTYSIDYKHVIHSLIKKPRAFRNCKYRDSLLPNDSYRKIWEYLDKHESYDVSPKIMLRLLKLASDYNCEKSLENYLLALIDSKKPLVISDIENKFNASNIPMPDVDCRQHDISTYDFIINKEKSGETHAKA